MSRLLAALFVLMTFTSFAVAQDEGGIPGMTLKLCDKSGAIVSTCLTNEDGSWSLGVAKPGEYSIVVDRVEFQLARNTLFARRDSVSGKVSDVRTFSDENAPRITIFWSMKDDATVSCYVASRDAATGRPERERTYAPVQFIKNFDRSVPIITCAKSCTISGYVSYTVTADTPKRSK